MLPEGWQLATFEDHIDLLSGFAFKSNRYTENESDVRLLRGDNIEPGRVRWRNAKRWPADKYADLEKYHLEIGDLVIAMDRTYVSAGLKVAEVGSGDTPSMLVQRLLRQYFSSHKFEQYVKAVQTETAVPHISARQIKDFPVPLPPVAEQLKIADVLATWDQAIETAEKLIENSKAQKKALMRQLLRGKKRLSSFSDEWSEAVLKNIAAVLVSPVNKKSVIGEPAVRLCNYTDVYYNTHITNSLDFMTATASNSEVERFTLKKNDLVITKDSETPGDIAVPALVSEELDNVVCGYHLAIIRPDARVVDGAFLNHLFSQSKVRHYFSTRANGATRFGLTIDGIKEASFMLPGIDEQKKIASVLDACDQELRYLSNVAQQLTKEKRALMQQLLTGKRRVKVAT